HDDVPVARAPGSDRAPPIPSWTSGGWIGVRSDNHRRAMTDPSSARFNPTLLNSSQQEGNWPGAAGGCGAAAQERFLVYHLGASI
ncbi:MAG: hypothetical protein ACE5HE_14940, partial [Phycisphaerae bacterium]